MNHTKNVVEWLDNAVSLYPDKVAFSNGDYSLTFSALQNEAKKIACKLSRLGFFKSPIIVALDKEPRAIAAFLGCAYSGNFYVPIDLEMPDERLQKIVNKLQPRFTITNENYSDLMREQVDENLLIKCSSKQIDTDLLYVLFTSGSTGIPKGVAVSHRSVIEYTENIQEIFGFDANTVHGHAAPLFFDLSILPIYQTLYCSSSNYMIPKKTLMFPSKIIDFLDNYKCNCIYWVPTSYSIIASSKILSKRVPKYLTKCLFVGEVMPVKTLNVWREYLPNCIFANLFGPTESTDTFLYYIVNRDFNESESIPIGKPYNNVDVLLLNKNDLCCKHGEVGEICVRGSKISFGYYNDSQITDSVFVQNPLNNFYRELIYKTGDLGYYNEYDEIMYVGRKDFQIKHAGHRIELGEIESIAHSVVGVDLCACVYDNDNQQIHLFYCGSITDSNLKDALKLKLQTYMIPSRIHKLDLLPRTPNGKISRVDLKKMI